MRRRPLLLAALLGLPFLFLFACLPPPDLAPDCLRRVTVATFAHFVHVCDSYGYTEEMQDLGSYLTAENHFTARPVYVIGSEGLAMVLRPAALVLRAALRDEVSGDFHVEIFLSRLAEYLALAVVNFLVLAAALRIAMGLIEPPDGALAAALGAAIATSDLVHGLFWTQHPNFMNLLVPIGCMGFFIAGCRARDTSLLGLAGLGLIAAAAMLAYGSAVVWLPAAVLGALYRDWRMAAAPAATLRGLIRLTLPLALCGCGPVLAWAAVNTLYLHRMLNYEANSLRQFLWLADAWHAHRLGAALVEHWDEYLPQVWRWLGWPAPAALAGLALLAFAGRRVWPWPQAARDPILMAGLVTVAGMLIFNFLQGYYQPRLVNGIVLVLFIAFARAAQMSGHPRAGAAALLIIAAGQTVGAFLEPPISLT